VYGQVGILTQAFLDGVRASDNSEQARIGHGLVIRALCVSKTSSGLIA
jgi:hypothetical protein